MPTGLYVIENLNQLSKRNNAKESFKSYDNPTVESKKLVIKPSF